MIDEDLIDSRDQTTRDQIREAIRVLAITGILSEQRQRLFAQIADGAEDAPVKDLVEAIYEYRRRVHALEGLENLGKEIEAEKNDA